MVCVQSCKNIRNAAGVIYLIFKYVFVTLLLLDMYKLLANMLPNTHFDIFMKNPLLQYLRSIQIRNLLFIKKITNNPKKMNVI